MGAYPGSLRYNRVMKILFLSAEVGPFVSVGGLSQVCYFLPRALSKQGTDVAIFTPKFGAMEATARIKSGWKFKNELDGLRVPIGDNLGVDDLICNIKSIQQTPKGVKAYFLENREYYELRANVFGYKDDHVRFMLMCKGCLEWLKTQNEHGKWFPDFIHINDWHAGYFAELARKNERYSEILKKVTIGLTVHNFTYQGNYEYKYCQLKDKDDGKKPLLPLLSENLIKQNSLMRAIKYSDGITTVSPTHALEVLTPEYGEGLEDILVKERDKLSGILNGLDTKEFDPAKDPLVPSHFSKNKFIEARLKNKKKLQLDFGLPTDPESFVLAYSGRLANQKGVGLLLESMSHVLKENTDIQLIVLGGGDDSYRKTLTKLAEKYPKQVGLHLLPNFKLPRKIFAGADGLLIPSLFEPGGIVALEALRYGAVPIVRRTGGLKDIVQEFDPTTKQGNGFSFGEKNAWALYGAIIRAHTTFRNKQTWYQLVQNCLSADFSWNEVAKLYSSWYARTIEIRKRALDIKNFGRKS